MNARPRKLNQQGHQVKKYSEDSLQGLSLNIAITNTFTIKLNER